MSELRGAILARAPPAKIKRGYPAPPALTLALDLGPRCTGCYGLSCPPRSVDYRVE